MAKISITSLGCPRNLVDSEVMTGFLKKSGHSITESAEDSDIAIINTCAFVKDAADESIDTIVCLADLKRKGRIKSVIVAGCLVQRYKKDLKKELGNVDAFVGTGDIEKITSAINSVTDKKGSFFVSDEPKYIYNDRSPRGLITPPHYAYIKIQEGCSNKCSYCIIPKLRGALRSRPIESILDEVSAFLASGVSELNIIGQDTTNYGSDIYKKPRIADLLYRISRLVKDRAWLRLLYTHPAHYTEDLIRVIKENSNICKYLDLPIQHISDRVLKRMKRGTTSSSIRALIERLRKCIPGLAIRTTLIVGFPGEEDADFEKLYNFVKETKFERLGVFAYSNEEGTPSYNYKNQVPEKIRRERLDRIMKLQQKISEEYNRSFLGRTIEVLIDEKDKDIYLGRTEYDAPSVDGQVYVRGRDLKIGSFVRVKITDTLEYDLAGVAV